MPISLILVLVLHAASAIAWTGVTFMLGWKSGPNSGRLFGPQIVLGLLTLGAGAHLWMVLHNGGTGVVEKVLGVGAVLGIAAFAAQLLGRRWSARVNKITFWMLIAAVVAMEFGKQLKGL